MYKIPLYIKRGKVMNISSINNIQNNNSTDISKSEKKKNKGTFKAIAAGSAVSAALTPLNSLALKGMQKIPKTLSKEQIQMINDAADKIIETSGLAAKGVKIDNVSGVINFSMFPDSVYAQINPYFAISEGKNAGFLTKNTKNILTGEIVHNKNTILVNKEKLPNAVFHEIGHAFNKNSSKIWKVVQKMRIPAMMIAAGLMLFSAFTKKAENEDGQELTKAQKTKNFVRKNSGILAFTAMLPVVGEEIMASVRGCKWANANLPKELAKKIKTTNIFGGITYILAAAGIGLAAHFATKVKDSAVDKANEK